MARIAGWILLGILLLGVSATAAFATTYYVRTDGSDSNSGTGNSAGGAWRTLGKANSTLRGGDIVNVISLNPADTASSSTNKIQPANSGSAGARIVYNGDTSNPGRLGIPDISLTKSYVTVTGFRSRGGADISSASGSGGDNCVIDRCVLTGNVLFNGATNSRFSHNSMKVNAGAGNVFQMDSRGQAYQATPSSYDTIRANVMDVGTIQDGGRTFVFRFGTNHCVVDSNRISGIMDNAGRSTKEETYAFVLYECNDMKFRYNKITWDIRSTGYESSAGVPWNALVLRSGASHNSFYGDTIIAGVTGTYSSRISLGQVSAGATDPPWQTSDNHWTRCVYKNRGGTIFFQDQFTDGSIDSCVFATMSNPSIHIGRISNSRIQNSTFITSGSKALFFEDGFLGSGSILRNNIFYSSASLGCPNGIIDFDVAPSGEVSSNYNLFYASSGSANAISWSSSCSGVGSGTSWCSSKNNDCNSQWANPLFQNANFDQLDVRLRAGSPAIGRALGGGDLGAIVYSIDTTPPAAIVTLIAIQLHTTDLTLSWTATGDDGLLGAAASYDIRRSTSPINASNFANATPVAGAPTPGLAGLVQTLLVQGLTPGQQYYFAIVARDEAGNASGLGNVLQITLPTTDTTPPAAVQDLSPTSG